MARLGYDRAFVDEAGNAVGEMGDANAARTVVLLGHIDTVPGDIPVRIEDSDGIDESAGPSSTGAAASMPRDRWRPLWRRLPMSAARGRVNTMCVFWSWARWRKRPPPARARASFATVSTATTQPLPDACIIGEPSSWRRVTLGYKGRLLVSLHASQPMAHTAGPDAGVSTVAVDFWNWIANYCDEFNADREKIFDRLLPSLRGLHSDTDEHLHDTVVAQSGIRLPLDFDVADLAEGLATWAVDRSGSQQGADVTSLLPEFDGTLRFAGSTCTIELGFRGYERAWRSDNRNDLVRCFLGAIREIDPGTRPGFVVKTGTSDMNVVGPAWQCPILAYGPGDSNLDHTPNEHIHLDEYWQAVQVLEQALRSWSLASR